jgi:hypothetical protein
MIRCCPAQGSSRRAPGAKRRGCGRGSEETRHRSQGVFARRVIARRRLDGGREGGGGCVTSRAAAGWDSASVSESESEVGWLLRYGGRGCCARKPTSLCNEVPKSRSLEVPSQGSPVATKFRSPVASSFHCPVASSFRSSVSFYLLPVFKIQKRSTHPLTAISKQLYNFYDEKNEIE